MLGPASSFFAFALEPVGASGFLRLVAEVMPLTRVEVMVLMVSARSAGTRWGQVWMNVMSAKTRVLSACFFSRMSMLELTASVPTKSLPPSPSCWHKK